jgi:hypothetical protein
LHGIIDDALKKFPPQRQVAGRSVSAEVYPLLAYVPLRPKSMEEVSSVGGETVAGAARGMRRGVRTRYLTRVTHR